MKNILAALALLLSVCSINAQNVIYQVSSPSFFDSDGDNLPDEKGIATRIDYINRMGFTTVMLAEGYVPGITNDILDAKSAVPKHLVTLVNQLHKRRMKVYMGVQFGSVSINHPWYKESVGRPGSKYSDYIVYADKQNKQPVYVKGSEANQKYVAVNLTEAKVVKYYQELLMILANGDGNTIFENGIDGFRFCVPWRKDVPEGLDEFWHPVFDKLEKAKPGTAIIGKQCENCIADNTDYMYSEEVNRNFYSLRKDSIASSYFLGSLGCNGFKIKLVSSPLYIKEQPKTIGQHKSIAAVNMLGDVHPNVNAGIEYGLGPVAVADYADAFTYHIPYKRSEREQWLTVKSEKFEQLQKDEQSLWNFYRELIELRRRQPSIGLGFYRAITNSNDNVISFTRTHDKEKSLVIINLSGEEQEVTITDDDLKIKPENMQLLMGTANHNFQRAGRTIVMPPHWVQVWRFISK